jgi:hypothetical protein
MTGHGSEVKLVALAVVVAVFFAGFTGGQYTDAFLRDQEDATAVISAAGNFAAGNTAAETTAAGNTATTAAGGAGNTSAPPGDTPEYVAPGGNAWLAGRPQPAD